MYNDPSNYVLIIHCFWMVLVVVCATMFLSVLKKFFWCPCMAINVSVQYNGGLLPDIILLTQCYYHRGTFFPLYGNKCSEGLDAFRFFFKNKRLICLYRTIFFSHLKYLQKQRRWQKPQAYHLPYICDHTNILRYGIIANPVLYVVCWIIQKNIRRVKSTPAPPPKNQQKKKTIVYVCCVLFAFILDVRLVDAPAGITQEEGHTGFLIHLPSVVLALPFIVRRIQPSLSLVDREVEFVYPRFNRSPRFWHDFFCLEKSQFV